MTLATRLVLDKNQRRRKVLRMSNTDSSTSLGGGFIGLACSFGGGGGVTALGGVTAIGTWVVVGTVRSGGGGATSLGDILTLSGGGEGEATPGGDSAIDMGEEGGSAKAGETEMRLREYVRGGMVVVRVQEGW